MRKDYPSLRLFKSDFWERFTHVHPVTPAVMWIPVVCFLIYQTVFIHEITGSKFFIYGASGFLFWTLTEYVLHRFAFHFPAKSAAGKRFVYIMHGLHHDDPNDPTRLVMPPVPALIYCAVLYTLYSSVLGPVNVKPFFAFFLLGYLCYDYIHYYVHHFTPTTKVGKYLKKYHMVHHFKDHGAKWGVSNPLWDYVFGTVEEKSVEKKAPKKTA